MFIQIKTPPDHHKPPFQAPQAPFHSLSNPQKSAAWTMAPWPPFPPPPAVMPPLICLQKNCQTVTSPAVLFPCKFEK